VIVLLARACCSRVTSRNLRDRAVHDVHAVGHAQAVWGCRPEDAWAVLVGLAAELGQTTTTNHPLCQPLLCLC